MKNEIYVYVVLSGEYADRGDYTYVVCVCENKTQALEEARKAADKDVNFWLEMHGNVSPDDGWYKYGDELNTDEILGDVGATYMCDYGTESYIRVVKKKMIIEKEEE